MSVAHVTFGTQDLERGLRFYDEIIEAFGGARTFTTERSAGWGFPNGGPSIGITLPFNGEAASTGNGTMFALAAANSAMVDAVHAAALAHGGTCEGAPGIRPNGFYCGYFRDPDGNKINAMCAG